MAVKFMTIWPIGQFHTTSWGPFFGRYIYQRTPYFPFGFNRDFCLFFWFRNRNDEPQPFLHQQLRLLSVCAYLVIWVLLLLQVF